MDYNYSLRQKWADDVHKLIFLYKQHSELYNGLSESQHGFVELTDQLNRVSANKYNIEEILAKIKALRKKMVDVERVRRETGIHPKWKHYNDLKFLIPYLQELRAPLIQRRKSNAKEEESSKKDRDAYVDSFINCVQMDLKKIKSTEKQDRLMRKIRSAVDAELNTK